MSAERPTREEREQELIALGQTSFGKAERNRLFFACLPGGQRLEPGTPMIQTILEHEYPVHKSCTAPAVAPRGPAK